MAAKVLFLLALAAPPATTSEALPMQAAPPARHPQDTEARLAATFLSLQLQRSAAAEDLLQGLPEDDPGVRLLWGRLSLMTGNPFAALEWLEPMAEDRPAALDRDWRHLMAEACLTKGESRRAVEILCDAVLRAVVRRGGQRGEELAGAGGRITHQSAASLLG